MIEGAEPVERSRILSMDSTEQEETGVQLRHHTPMNVKIAPRRGLL